MNAAQYIEHLKTITTHEEAVEQLTLFSRATLEDIARTLNIRYSDTRARLIQSITSVTVDSRTRSAIIRNLKF